MSIPLNIGCTSFDVTEFYIDPRSRSQPASVTFRLSVERGDEVECRTLTHVYLVLT